MQQIIADEVPLSEVSISGWHSITISISLKAPCLTIIALVPPRYSPGQPIRITEPPILSIICPSVKEALTDMLVSALCPVIWP